MRQWWGMRRLGHTLSSKTQLVANDTTFGARGLGLRLQTRGHNGLNYGLNGSASQSTNKDTRACTREHTHARAHTRTLRHKHMHTHTHRLNITPWTRIQRVSWADWPQTLMERMQRHWDGLRQQWYVISIPITERYRRGTVNCIPAQLWEMKMYKKNQKKKLQASHQICITMNKTRWWSAAVAQQTSAPHTTHERSYARKPRGGQGRGWGSCANLNICIIKNTLTRMPSYLTARDINKLGNFQPRDRSCGARRALRGLPASCLKKTLPPHTNFILNRSVFFGIVSSVEF